MKTEILNPTDALKWRYAAKRMTAEVVPNHLINTILEAAWLSPSGIGLQPYEILVITNPELKAQILPIIPPYIAFLQQIMTASQFFNLTNSFNLLPF